MNRFEFYKESYYLELERKRSLDKSLSLPLGIVILTGTILTNIIFNINSSEHGISTIILIVFIVLTILIGIKIISELLKSYMIFKNGYNYHYLPNTKESENYYKELIKYKSKVKNKKYNVEEEFENYLIKKLNQCNENNVLKNENKIYHLFIAKRYIMILFFTLIITLITYGINYYEYNKNEKEIKVKIESPIKIIQPIKTKSQKEIKMTEKERPQEELKKPVEPKIRIIQEGVKPEKIKKEN